MFASKVRNTIVLMDEGKEVAVVIQKLSAKHLTLAAETRQAAAAETTRRYGADVLKAFRETAEAAAQKKPSAEEQRKADIQARYAAYDRGVTLDKGVVSWSLKTDLKKGIEDLDEESAELLHKAIIDLSVPLPEVVEEEEGKD